MVKGQFQKLLDLAFHQGCKFIDAYYKAARNLVDRLRNIKINFCQPKVSYHQITKSNSVISIRQLHLISLNRVATPPQELSFSMTFPWLSMTKNQDFSMTVNQFRTFIFTNPGNKAVSWRQKGTRIHFSASSDSSTVLNVTKPNPLD